MLTEVDTRMMYGSGDEVTLWMDTDAKVYQVSVTGHAPIICLTRDRAVQAFHHPYVYLDGESNRSDMAAGGSESDPNATEEHTPRPKSVTAESPSESLKDPQLSDLTGRTLVQLRDILAAMNDSDFRWTVSIIDDLVQNMTHERMTKPYDQEADGPDIPF